MRKCTADAVRNKNHLAVISSVLVLKEREFSTVPSSNEVWINVIEELWEEGKVS